MRKSSFQDPIDNEDYLSKVSLKIIYQILTFRLLGLKHRSSSIHLNIFESGFFSIILSYHQSLTRLLKIIWDLKDQIKEELHLWCVWMFHYSNWDLLNGPFFPILKMSRSWMSTLLFKCLMIMRLSTIIYWIILKSNNFYKSHNFCLFLFYIIVYVLLIIKKMFFVSLSHQI